MRIAYNASAVFTKNALASNNDLMAKSMERLSSGLKINHAKDNPSGLAMAKRMNAQLSRTAVSIQNASDGISVIETADGALAEINNMLARMRELAVQAANDTLTEEDKATAQAEVSQLKEEITALANNTQFNGQPLLNGEFEAKGYTNTEGLQVQSYSSEVERKTYTIQSLTVREETDENGVPTGYQTVDPDSVSLGAEFPPSVTCDRIQDGLLTLKGENGFEMQFDVNGLSTGSHTGIEANITGIGAMRMQIGPREGQVIELDIPQISLRNLAIEKLDISTKEGASKGIGRIDQAVTYLTKVRSKLGAYQNRMEATASSLEITQENLTGAYSRIMDVDMAEEMTRYTTYQVLTQAGTSMLAQANESPSSVLQLLQ
ncbi:MAG: flagellin [Lachnospiraceae bacterium]|nr:flagellin [Lachnospiraceae bacterium]